MSNNVWADLGFANPEDMQAKCDVSIEIERLMLAARLSKRRAAARMGISVAELQAILDADVESLDLSALERYRDDLHAATTAAR